MRRNQTPLRMLLFLLCSLGILPATAHATDVRLALLVGHQVGWKEDPKLQYVYSGDLHPLQQTLQQLGFTVKIVFNKDANTVRQAFEWAQKRVQRSPRVTTFLFYYSGHADRSHFHLGPNLKNPLSYREFVSFLRKLPVKRRIAFFDACFSGEIVRQFGSLTRYKDLVRKGASGFQPLDISKTIPYQGEEEGLQVISSSVNYAWESRKYRASIFTHHLLQGLHGDADRDNDGRISVDELFTYISDSMIKDIRQKPQMFGVVQRSRPYALAPAYHSQLRIGSQVLGTLRVSVANFVWKQRKQHKRPMQLSVVHGWGTVELTQGRQCLQQRIYLPKGGLATLQSRWNSVPCERIAYTRKGSILLETRIAPPTLHGWQVELSTGTWGSPAISQSLPMFGGNIGLRWKWIGLFLEIWGGQRDFSSQTLQQMYTGLRMEGGYHGNWGSWSLFAGAYAGAGLLFQDVGKPDQSGVLFRYGITAAPGYWFHPNWGVALHGQIGFLLGQFGPQLKHELDANARLSLQYRW